MLLIWFGPVCWIGLLVWFSFTKVRFGSLASYGYVWFGFEELMFWFEQLGLIRFGLVWLNSGLVSWGSRCRDRADLSPSRCWWTGISYLNHEQYLFLHVCATKGNVYFLWARDFFLLLLFFRYWLIVYKSLVFPPLSILVLIGRWSGVRFSSKRISRHCEFNERSSNGEIAGLH